MMRLIRNSKAFTLVEVLIVVAILGLLAAIAVPNFMKARSQAELGMDAPNMRMIEDAIDRYAIEKGKLATDTIDATNEWKSGEIWAHLKGGILPTCPTPGKTYGLKTGATYDNSSLRVVIQ